MVLFKFKPEVTKEQVKEVVDAFAALPKKIDTIKDYEAGTDVSVEGKIRRSHARLCRDVRRRERSRNLPARTRPIKEFVELVGPRIEKVLVFDYWTGK